MVRRTLLAYAVAEIVAVIGLVWAFGWLWTLAIVAAVFGLGLLLAGTQLKSQITRFRGARTTPRSTSRDAATDGALVGLGTVLVLVPGVVSTAAGALMLAPPTRGAMRPLAAALLARGITRRFGAVTLIAPPGFRRTDFIDAEVIDAEVIDADPPAIR